MCKYKKKTYGLGKKIFLIENWKKGYGRGVSNQYGNFKLKLQAKWTVGGAE